MRKVIFINSHPIQYFAPLYKYLCQHDIPTECWYCSDENVRGHVDRQFGTKVEWDVPLLEGYASRFFKNYSFRPSLYNGFFGLFNPGMVKALFNEKPAIIVVHGWAYFTHLLVLLFGRLAGHTICVRGESPLNQELRKSKSVQLIKNVLLGKIIFRAAQYCLFIGKQNRAFYEHYGVKSERLVFTPYAVDNSFFRGTAAQLLPMRKDLRRSLGISETARVILFAAKLIHKKRPMDLLRAYQQLGVADKCLVMVGDGELKGHMQQFIAQERLQNVHLPGFVNQSAIGQYYAIADVFVLCSGDGETWGLSVNEAMNFNLPIVVSSTSGCSPDLVVEGKTGFEFPEGDIESLGQRLSSALELEDRCQSAEWIRRYSFDVVAGALSKVASVS